MAKTGIPERRSFVKPWLRRPPTAGPALLISRGCASSSPPLSALGHTVGRCLGRRLQVLWPSDPARACLLYTSDAADDM
eukprot:13096112-Alexandrium_andersonii.AAC.1